MFDTSELLAAIQSGDTARVKTKLDAQPNLLQDLSGPNGESLLMLAVQAGNPETVKYLLEKGADVNATGPTGMTPLHLAAQQGEEELILLLLKSKADINAVTTDGQSPMELAIKNGHDAAKWFSI